MLLAGAASAQDLRVATYHAAFSRKGPGLLLRDILKGEDPQITAAVQTIRRVDPDVLLLTRFDYDFDMLTLSALNQVLEQSGGGYAHLFALRPNTGVPTGRDIDQDGLLGGPRDAQGYGTFSGQGGMALLSRFPIQTKQVQDLSGLLWRDLPGTLIADDDPAFDIQRLSSSGHWIVPLTVRGQTLAILAFYATPPVFDGPEDRNGRRNHDEIVLWQRLLDGQLAIPPPDPPFVLAGLANLDPRRGEGRREAMADLLDDPRFQAPSEVFGKPTVDWPPPGPGKMRVSYVLPAAGTTVLDAGVTALAEGQHSLVWADLRLRP